MRSANAVRLSFIYLPWFAACRFCLTHFGPPKPVFGNPQNAYWCHRASRSPTGTVPCCQPFFVAPVGADRSAADVVLSAGIGKRGRLRRGVCPPTVTILPTCQPTRSLGSQGGAMVEFRNNLRVGVRVRDPETGLRQGSPEPFTF